MNRMVEWQGDLQSRPVYIGEDTLPQIDENMDVYLALGGRIVSAPARTEAQEAAILRVLVDMGTDGRHEIVAVTLRECERVALVAPIASCLPEAALVIVPRIGRGSMLRVLSHTFDGQVTFLGREDVRTPDAPRESDAPVYSYLRWLISRLRAISQEAETVDITDRRQLSERVLSVFSTLECLLGVEIPMAHTAAFPVAYAFCGAFSQCLALWMQLLLVLGLRRGFAAKVWRDALLTADHELLLPTLEIPVGNRTPLPREWEVCRHMAEETGMFFDVQRKRDRIRVRFCPMTPHIAPAEFYSVKAMAPIVEGIKAMTWK